MKTKSDDYDCGGVLVGQREYEEAKKLYEERKMNDEMKVQEEKQVGRQLRLYGLHLEEMRTRVENLTDELTPILYFCEAKCDSSNDPVGYSLCSLAEELAVKNELFSDLLRRLSDINHAIEL